MSARELATAWLAEAMGQGFEVRDDGVYTLVESGNQIVVELPDQGEAFYLHAPIAPVPEIDVEAFFRRALRMNLLCMETRGATLALDGGGGQLVLCYAANTTSMDPIAFANLVGSFLEAARAVRDQFAEPLRVAAPAAGELPFGEALRI